MRFCMYYDVGGARGMRDVMREYEWYYRNRSRRILKIHVLVTTYEALIKDYEVRSDVNCYLGPGLGLGVSWMYDTYLYIEG